MMADPTSCDIINPALYTSQQCLLMFHKQNTKFQMALLHSAPNNSAYLCHIPITHIVFDGAMLCSETVTIVLYM